MIRLRPLEREDLRQLRDWRNDPEIFSRVREYRYLNMENQEAWFNSLRDDRKTIMFGVEDRTPTEYGGENRILIGVCGLTYIDWIAQKAEISLYIGDKDYRGMGIGLKMLNLLAKYAFEECNLIRLWGEIYDSEPIIQLFKRAGYIKEGELRQHAYKNGKYVNSHFYGLLREEWRKKNARVV